MTGRRIVAVVVAALLVLGALGTALALVVGGGLGESASEDGRGDRPPPRQPEDPSDPAVTEAPSPELAEFYSQQLEWTECGDRECSELTVPIDYRDPAAGTIGIALKRAPAQDAAARVGSLVVNPGGPGSPGTDVAEDAHLYFRDPLREAYDIVGFDPRGTGSSAPVDCVSDEELDEFMAGDPSPDDPGEDQELVESLEQFFAGCVERSADVVGHVSTNEAARDMDVLRAALREEQLHYLGYSYGTRLGATYAELFPQRVGRFVLDGAIDPTLSARQSALNQAGGFETALRSYVSNCLEVTDSCFLGDSVDEGLTTIRDLLEQIDDEPLPTNQDRDLQIGNAFYGLVTPLYAEANWPVLTQALKQALDGNGSVLLLLSDLYSSRKGGEYTDNSREAIYAINCLDDPSHIEPGEVRDEYAAFLDVSPTLGEVFAWGLVNCRGLQVEPAYEPLEITAEGAAPIVVIGTTRDPATPYEEAVALAEQLDSGVLVTRDGDGHTAYNRGSSCIDEAVEGYLVDGKVPEDGLEC